MLTAREDYLELGEYDRGGRTGFTSESLIPATVETLDSFVAAEVGWPAKSTIVMNLMPVLVSQP